MNQADQNINKDMFDCDLIDVESMDFSDDQTWLYEAPEDSGQKVDIVDWNLSLDWPNTEDQEYLQMEKEINALLDNIIKSQTVSLSDKNRFDSRTYVKPKKRVLRPSIQNIVEVPSNQSSMSPHPSLNPTIGALRPAINALNPAINALNPAINALNHAANSPANKYLTYNKYNSPLGPISPMLRLKTFNVDTNTDNSTAVKEYALKRRSLVQDEDPQLEDMESTQSLEALGRLSVEHAPSKPINIDLSQPAHNLHNTFNKGLTNILNERGSLNMYQSGDSLMRMSPPSLVSSLMMESSGTFNLESMESRKSITSHKDSGLPTSGRDSIDPMMTSMTLSILDEKDMSTSFLSQTTYHDHDSLIDSLPPSLVSSVNSSYIVSNTSKPRENDSNIFSSATFTHLEQSEKLLSARPRCPLYNSFLKRDSSIRNSDSYTKSREEACQIDTAKVLNENTDNESPKPKPHVAMTETITLHFSSNKFSDAEKENFERDDTFYKDMGLPKPEDAARDSLNVTLGKQELNEIIQARQKLSLARKALPSEPASNQTEAIKTIQLPNQTITVPRQSMENASELLSRRRALNGFERPDEPPKEAREVPKRNATFKVSPKLGAMETTVVFMRGDDEVKTGTDIIDINSATMNLLAEGDRTLQQEEWGSQERAMVGSSESTDTGTFSSSSPPDSVPDTTHAHDTRSHVVSTPLMSLRKGAKDDLLNLHNTISPIYDMVDDKSYTVTKAPNMTPQDRTFEMNNTVINSATMVKKTSAKRDILAPKQNDKKLAPSSQMKLPFKVSATGSASYGVLIPPPGIPRKSSLPTSKLRQYSSHRELSRIPGGPPTMPRGGAGRTMIRRGVYGSNPALSPTAAAAPHGLGYAEPDREEDKPSRPTLMNPPALIRQGTETLRRERPQSQLVGPKDPPTTRPYSVAGATQLRVTTARPVSGPAPKCVPAVPVLDQPRPASSSEARISALPRPSRLPAPRRALRPPSVYSVAPTADADHY